MLYGDSVQWRKTNQEKGMGSAREGVGELFRAYKGQPAMLSDKVTLEQRLEGTKEGVNHTDGWKKSRAVQGTASTKACLAFLRNKDASAACCHTNAATDNANGCGHVPVKL